MKTGRVRRKAELPPEEEVPSVQAPSEVETSPVSEPPVQKPRPGGPPSPMPSPRPATPPARSRLFIGCFAAVILAIVIIAVLTLLLSGGRGGTEWIKATRATGNWTTTVTVFGPQVTTMERWEDDCRSDPSATAQLGSCVLRDTDAFQDRVVDDYEEYVNSTYYEETWDRVYQVQGTEFVPGELGADQWWEDNRHYVSEEQLDRDSCTYTQYTVWVDDPKDRAQEIEVYLSECEVWDHITVYERQYEQRRWCLCDVSTLAQLGQVSEQGTGARVVWSNASLPAGGRADQSFSGQVTFLGDDYTYMVTTQDLEEYQRYLTGQYYIGIRNGRPVAISANPPR